ncbi:fimbrial protein [Mangrovibacter plantisponsor]|uniref:Major type 1 subunit fimbrin (Pilin) n=1 Tax=Mangrovibacter plantisponsor TaxID=451513 RepID=A0A317PWN7_9ENTR|nr:fimbrial protein [Mangrovibacter plantisponsor]PWW07088.1 major type 1 subunit fimbrin (pilin) [Mangrovibacter plantisponsor]
MKKLVLASALSVLFASQAFAASDNTITFKGEVADETCTVTVNGNASSPLVLLPTVSTSDLSQAADTAGQTTFDIAVTDCPAALDGKNISTRFAGNNVSTNGNLGNIADDAAANVEVQILDTANAAIDLTSEFTADGDLSLASGESEATATYTAQYYATAASTAGAVEGTMQYAVIYD